MSDDDDDGPDLWTADLGGWLALQQSFVKRIAQYVSDVGDRASAGSIEPRGWIGDYANLWGGLIADVNDWMRAGTGRELRGSEEWLSRHRITIPEGGRSVRHLAIDVHDEVFGQEEKIHLATAGFSRAGAGGLEPEKNIAIVPRELDRNGQRSEVKLFGLDDIPRGLYSGLVWAEETGIPVALVEVEIVPRVRRKRRPRGGG